MQPSESNSSKFHPKAWAAIVQSQDVVRRYRHQNLEAEHLMIALLEQPESLATKALAKVGVDTTRFAQQIDDFTNRQPKLGSVEQLYVGYSLEKLLDRADIARNTWQDPLIGTEHLLIAFSTDPRLGIRLFRAFNLDIKQLETALKEVRATQKATPENGSSDSKESALERFGRDLTALAQEGKIDPVIGRDEEIRRVIQVLSRRSKNNPVLIGEPGVGKTAIAEGLAQRILDGQVPESLKGRKLISLDMGSVIAGAKYRGEFEERLRSVLKEVMASEGQIVLFIDELHTVVGAGGNQGTMDAGNLLKPMLARGELRCIGASTIEEYRKNVEKDPALERRFQQVLVQEPTVEDTVSILRGLKERYEVHHGVKISDAALVAAATLSFRYISDRFLPDKAIDLVDEAAAKLKVESTSKPEELENIERRVMQLKIEKKSLEQEGGNPSSTYAATKESLARVTKELEERELKKQVLEKQWNAETNLKDAIYKLHEEEKEIKLQLDRAERDYDANRVAELTYGTLHPLQKKLAEQEAQLAALQAQGSILRQQQVMEADIAEIVAKWTGIPVNRLMESERQKLLNLESHLHERVVGQTEAVEALAAAIRRARSGMKDPSRPIGSFLFMGPTGVGKTELARALAQFLFDSDDAMIRLDMSEYMDKTSMMRIVGAPPGYIGYEEGGQLTEAIRRKPYSVLLFDEVEKAHPDIFNLLLQVLDDGRITDGQGRTVSFANTVIIMTSNIGSEHILEVSGDDSRFHEMEDRVMNALRKHFRPEFLNRIDDMILFHPLGRQELSSIVGLQIKRIEALLADQKIALEITDSAKAHIADAGYDPTYGARPLKRAIQRLLQNPIATLLLEGKFTAGDTILIGCAEGKLTFDPMPSERRSRS
ncbi:MAG: ATP-dependent chaperone ClpB [Synechococcales bacterium]|nr:ATP-dependent chaperone ClpB [Synechococcales bacterium]